MVASTVAVCLLQLVVVDVVEVRVGDRAAVTDGEIVDVVEHERRDARRPVGPDVFRDVRRQLLMTGLPRGMSGPPVMAEPMLK